MNENIYPPILKVHEKYPTLGKNYFCINCGVMFIDYENQPTNFCGNCGVKLRGIENEST